MNEDQKARLTAKYEEAKARGMNPADIKDPELQNFFDEVAKVLLENFDRTIPFEYAEKLIGVLGFFRKLIDEDDWTVIIKLHALLESVLSHALADALKHPELISLFAELPMSDARFGKVKFLRELNLIADEHMKFIYRLSQLRNEMAHDARNVTFSLKDYVGKMQPNEIKAFFNAIVGKEFAQKWTPERLAEYKETPKKTLVLGTFSVLATLIFFGAAQSVREKREKPSAVPAKPE